MLKQLWLSATCLLASPLISETIGNVEFQFPPSNYEWKLLATEHFFLNCNAFEDAQSSEGLNSITSSEDPFELKMFTHREGDALEIFTVLNSQSAIDNEDDDSEEPIDTLETVQQQLDQTVNQFFPSHQLVVTAFNEDDNQALVEWELNDGVQDVFHGFTRGLTAKTDTTQTCTILSYMTTAAKCDCNRTVWIDFLNQISPSK